MTSPGADAAPDSLRERAAALGVALSPAAAALLARYLDAMLRENEHVNLTAIRAREQATVLHVLDSVAVALAVPAAPATALDLGTGNGFPGIAVAALWPTCCVTLCDRTQKKVAAIERALAAGEVAQYAAHVQAVAVDVAQAPALRAEWRASMDLVTARAVAAPLEVARLAQPLLRPAGSLVLWLDADGHAPGAKGYEPPRVLPYRLPDPAPRARRLACYRRIRS